MLRLRVLSLAAVLGVVFCCGYGPHQVDKAELHKVSSREIPFFLLCVDAGLWLVSKG